MKKERYWLSIIFLLLCLSACQSFGLPVPTETGDDWQTAAPSQVGLDERPLAEAIEGIDSGRYPNVHSLLIVKDGQLVLEEYFDGHAWQYDAEQYEGPLVAYGPDQLHTIMSITKAFTAALVGIAIEEGFVANEQAKLFDFFPGYQELNNQQKDQMTLEHLLTMTSGLEWNEVDLSYSDLENDLIQLFVVEDPVAYMLGKPLLYQPGSHWCYSGGDVNLLGEVIQESTGLRMDQYAAERLMAPLGITEYQWDFINPDLVHASGNLMLRPRDMAKFGYLMLNDGIWQDQQILPPAWIEKTKQAFISAPWPEMGEQYGYQWWIKQYPFAGGQIEALHRSGWGGQAILVFDELEMVVVFTGGNYVANSPNHEIITRHILPAAVGNR